VQHYRLLQRQQKSHHFPVRMGRSAYDLDLGRWMTGSMEMRREGGKHRGDEYIHIYKSRVTARRGDENDGGPRANTHGSLTISPFSILSARPEIKRPPPQPNLPTDFPFPLNQSSPVCGNLSVCRHPLKSLPSYWSGWLPRNDPAIEGRRRSRR